MKLKKDVPLAEIESMLASANRWVRVIPNRREDSIRELSPARVSGQLETFSARDRQQRQGVRVFAHLRARVPEHGQVA